MNIIRQQNIIMFSASKSNEKCETILSFFRETDHQCYKWDSLFEKSRNQNNRAIFNMLIKKIPTFDFAIIIGDATDKLEHETTKEGKKENIVSPVMRDNVLFECGLCIMALGMDRVILLKEESIRLPEDLYNRFEEMGIKTKEMGIKTFEYSNDLANLHKKLEDVNKYIEEKASEISPIVVGAAISTAAGYFNNFILRFWEKITYEIRDKKNITITDLKTGKKSHPDVSQICMNIYIPDKISSDLKENMFNYYERNNYKQGIIISQDTRGVEFRYKIIRNEFIICDYPTTFTASYNTVREILGLNADEKQDEHAEERFLMKERDSFMYTLKKLKDIESLKLEELGKNETEKILNWTKQIKIIEDKK